MQSGDQAVVNVHESRVPLLGLDDGLLLAVPELGLRLRLLLSPTHMSAHYTTFETHLAFKSDRYALHAIPHVCWNGRR